MVKEVIRLGAEPNDGTGDPLRVAFARANANFDELYAGIPHERSDLANAELSSSWRADEAGNLGLFVGPAGAADADQTKVATIDKATGQLVLEQSRADETTPDADERKLSTPADVVRRILANAKDGIVGETTLGEGLVDASTTATTALETANSATAAIALLDDKTSTLEVDLVTLDDKVDALELDADSITKATWTTLNAIAGTRDGQRGLVPISDAGTHTDPVVGGTVANSGTYSWSVSPAGWQRVDVYQNVAAVSAEVTTARQAAASLDARINLINRAKVWNAVDPLTISEIGLHVITNATNLPSDWPSAPGPTATLFVWQVGSAIVRDLRPRNSPEYEWRSSAGAAWARSSATLIDIRDGSANAKVWNAVDPLTISELGVHVVTNATNLPTGWPGAPGPTAALFVYKVGNILMRDIRPRAAPEHEWRSANGAAWVKSSATLIEASQLSAGFAYRGLVDNPDFDTIRAEGVYVLTGTYTHGPAGILGGTALLEVRVAGNFQYQVLRLRTSMDRIYQRSSISTTYDPWETIGGVVGGGGSGAFAGKTIALLGDSITEFGNWPEQMCARLGATLLKGGFGGARMSVGSTLYDPFSAYQLSRRIKNGDWSVLTDAAQALFDAIPSDDNRPQAAALAGANWSLVSYVMINFSTNDWSAGIPIGADSDTDGSVSFKGAINEVITNILTTYPKIRLLFGTPIYRSVGGSGGGSDVAVNGIGLKLDAYADAIIDRCKAHHVEFVDLYRTSGINALTASTLLADGVHPYQVGYDLLAGKNAGAMMARW